MCAISHGVIDYGRNEKEAAVQGGAVLSSGEPDYGRGRNLFGGAVPAKFGTDTNHRTEVS